jgi:hypothetical protein
MSKPKKKCATKWCRNRSKNNKCSKCYNRAWNKNNPMKKAYQNLKGHAKERGIEFNLTFSEFKGLPFIDEYMENKGRKTSNVQMDRKDSTKGYEKDNLQLLTTSQNASKGANFRWHDEDFYDGEVPF